MRREEIDTFLSSQRNATLASLGVDGFPHQVAMWFVPENDRIVMWTFRRSQKAVNLRRNPAASFMVQDGDHYGELRGVAVRGSVELVEDTDRVLEIGHRLHSRYGTGYGHDPEAYRAEIARQAPKRVGIYLPMRRLTSWDFRKL
jgi:PPOX class probable F420-dependent enzyme